MEERMVLSSAKQFGSLLNVIGDPGTATSVRSILLQTDALDHSKIDVSDTGTLLGKFTISSINKVHVSVAGNDAVKVDDSNGIPFTNVTTISLAGSGVNNSLALVGSRALNFIGSEIFQAGSAAFPTAFLLGNGAPEFFLNNAISSVTDDLTANELVVEAPGQAVTLAGPNGVTETFKGLAGLGAGGSTLTFRGKHSVLLGINSDNATADLNATAAAQGLQFFEVDVSASNDRVNINETPGNVNTHIQMGLGTFDSVLVRGNLGPVSINGNATTIVDLGTNAIDSSKSVTSGIKANVSVNTAEILNILDGGDATTAENMLVTESTISGTGMFGNNAVVVHYADTVPTIETGRLANSYTVAGSHAGATFFPGGISINDDFSSAGLSVHVSVDPGSALNLSLFNQNASTGSLVISVPFGTGISPVPTAPSDFLQVFAPGASQPSDLSYNGFDNVTVQGHP